MKAAAWVGNRRWDLTFDTGETLALPQDRAEAALVKFAQLDGARPRLGKGWLRFDLRDPARLVADSRRARAELNWEPRYADLATMIAHAWRWETRPALSSS